MLVDNPTRISYVITNVGDTSGEIEESDVSVNVSLLNHALPIRPPYNFPGNNRLNGIKIAVGDTERQEETSPDLSESIYILQRQTSMRIMLVGWILYKNPGGSRRYTAFCRVYDYNARGFVKPKEREDSPEYDRYEYIA